MLLPHRLELHASRQLAIALAFMHLAAMASLLVLPFPHWHKLALAAVIFGSVSILVRRHALLLSAVSIRELVLNADGSVGILRNDGRRTEGRVSRQSTVLPYLIVILLDLPGSRGINSLLILPDSLTVEDRRLLRTWLRWKIT